MVPQLGSQSDGTVLSLGTRTMRPSLFDSRFKADTWLIGGDDGPARLQLGDFPLALVAALPVDLPFLNQLVIRARRPLRH